MNLKFWKKKKISIKICPVCGDYPVEKEFWDLKFCHDCWIDYFQSQNFDCNRCKTEKATTEFFGGVFCKKCCDKVISEMSKKLARS